MGFMKTFVTRNEVIRQIKSYNRQWRTDRTLFVLNTISLLVILISLSIVALLYATNRSLWADESTLAYSVTTRDLSNLTASVLKNRQSSPVLYLYIVKFITLIFENSPFFLRIYSFIAYVGTLILTHQLLKKMAKVKFPLVGASFTASMMIILYFANEFKQYMSDAFTVLLIIYLFHLFEQRKINVWLLFSAYVILTWLAFPAIFIIGGIAITLFIRQLLVKDWKNMVRTSVCSIAVLISFAVEYFYWLRLSSDHPKTLEHWIPFKFPIIPTSLDDVIRGARLIYGVALSLNQYPEVKNTIQIFPVLIVLLMLIGLLSGWKEKNELVILITSGMLVLMMASYIGKYPFFPRLILFVYPLLAILVVIAIDFLYRITKPAKLKHLIAFGLTACLFLGNSTSMTLYQPENRLRINEESTPLIQYVQKNIQKNEYVYIYGADMNVSYLNGYDNNHIGLHLDKSIENIRFNQFASLSENPRSLQAYQQSNAYILISHANQALIDSLIQPLIGMGYLEKILDVRQTPLYFHAQDLSSVKSAATYQLKSLEWSGNTATVGIRVENTGQAILNVANLAALNLASRELPDLTVPVQQQDILPGSSIELSVVLEFPQSLQQVNLQLMYKDQYWFDEIGVQPLTITRP